MNLDKDAEGAAGQREELLRKVLEILPIGVWIIDKDGKVLHGNPAGQCLWAGARFVGIDQYGEYKGWRLDTGEKIEPAEWAAARAIQKGETAVNEEVEIECFDGAHKIILNSAVPVKNAKQEIIGAIVVNQDITERKKAEKTLIEQSRILEAFFRHTITPLAILDRNFNFIRVNKAYAKAGQRDVSEYPGHNHFEFYPSDARAIFDQVVETKKPYQTIARPFVFPDHPEWGVTYWDWTLTPLSDNRNEVEFLVFSLEDVTDRKKAEQRIIQQNELLNNILEALTHPFYVIDANDYTVNLANSAARIEGQSGTSTCYALSHHGSLPCDGEEHPCVITMIKEKKTSVTVEHIHHDKDGIPKIIEVHGYPLFDSDGNIVQVIEYNLDITERRRAEELTREAGAYNRSLIEASLDPLVTIGPDGRIADVNAATEAVTGYVRANLIGTDFSDYFTAPEKARAGYRKAFQEGAVRDYPLEIQHRDGHITSVLYNASVFRDKGGKIVGVFAAARDITERRQAEKVSQLLSSIVQYSNDAIIGKTLNGKITSWNRGAEKIYGYRENEVIGKLITILIPDDRKEEELRILDKLSRGEHIENYETDRKRKDGQMISVSLTISPIIDAEGWVVGASTIARDITERKRGEDALREQERHAQSLLRVSKRLELAQTYDEALKAARDEVRTIIGYQDLWAYFFTEDKKYAKLLVAEGPMAETLMSEEGAATLTIEGDRMLEEIVEAKEIVVVDDARTDERTNKEIVARLQNRTIVNVPIILMDKHLGSVGTGTYGDEGVRVPAKSEQKYLSALASHMAVTFDRIHLQTERKRAEEALGRLNEELEQRVKARTEELERANDKLMEVDRMKSMFIASMSHELRTPLNSVIGFSSILLNEWTGPVNAEQKEDLSAILRSGRHLLNLINDVIDVSKIEAGKIDSVIERFDLHDVIEEAVNFLTKEINEKRLSLTVEAMHQEMLTDRRRLLQCVLNLLSNAVKFTEKGSVHVQTRLSGDAGATRWVALEEGQPAPEKGRPPGSPLPIDFVEISVSDTGIGIREEDCPKLFNAFVRLDSPMRASVPGTGLGLYLTRKLVAEVLKGDILLSSRHGEGSTFTIVIPARIDEKGLGNRR